MAGRLVSIVTGSLLVVPVYFLLLRGYNRRIATWGALFAAVHPLFIYYSTQVLAEATYTFCFVSGVFVGWQALASKRARYFALTGVVFAACYLIRAEAFGFLLLMLAVTLLACAIDKSISKTQLLVNSLALVAGFLLLAAPYIIHLRLEYSAWTISAKLSGHMWQGNRGLNGGAVSANAIPAHAVDIYYVYAVRKGRAQRIGVVEFCLSSDLRWACIPGLVRYRLGSKANSV